MYFIGTIPLFLQKLETEKLINAVLLPRQNAEYSEYIYILCVIFTENSCKYSGPSSCLCLELLKLREPRDCVASRSFIQQV